MGNDGFEDKRLRAFSSAAELRGKPWRQAYFNLTGKDSRLLGVDEVAMHRRVQLRHGLGLSGSENVDQVAQAVKAAILETLRTQTEFRLNALNTVDLRRRLSAYLMVRAAETRLKVGRRYGDFDTRLCLRQGQLSEVLYRVAFGSMRRDLLEGKLEHRGIRMNARVTRLLISEINAEGPLPRILGLVETFRPPERPLYVALPEGEFSRDFLSACRIFDH